MDNDFVRGEDELEDDVSLTDEEDELFDVELKEVIRPLSVNGFKILADFLVDD